MRKSAKPRRERNAMEKIILVHVTGGDRPGLTSELTNVLAGFEVDILDIGQVVIHNFLTLGILIRLPSDSQPVLKDLLFRAHELGVTMKLHPLAEEDYGSWVKEADKQRHIITLLARSISAQQIAAITNVVSESGLNIDTIHRLSGLNRSIATTTNAPAAASNSLCAAHRTTSVPSAPNFSIFLLR